VLSGIILYADYASVYRLLHVYSSYYSMSYMLQKHPGSTGTNENQSGKPPLPNNAIAELRKGSYYASLDLVQSLCDTSYGLVDIFPVEDRKIALREVGQSETHCLAAIWFSTSWLSAICCLMFFFYVAVSCGNQFPNCFC
jgi:hypothetical protein